jgi:hypothetical protein
MIQRTIPATSLTCTYLRRLALSVLFCAVLSVLTLAQTNKSVRFFDVKVEQSARGMPYAEPNRSQIGGLLLGAHSMLGVPKAKTWKVEWVDEKHKAIRFSQSFRIVDSTILDSAPNIIVYSDIPTDLFREHRSKGSPEPKISELEVARQSVAPWEESKQYALLVQSYDHQNATAQMIAERAIKASKLEGKDGKTAYFKTLVKELPSLDPKDEEQFLYYFGKISVFLRGNGSVSYGGAGEFGLTVGNYALELAGKSSGKKKVWLTFIGAIWGNARGFEPFFSELRPTINVKKSDVDVRGLRMLAGSVMVRQTFYLDNVLYGKPPTRTWKSMVEFALSFKDCPDVMAFLMEFIVSDSRIPGIPSKEDWIKAYLATDEGMNYQDRYSVYQSISRYFEQMSGTETSIPMAIQYRMVFPDGLGYPGDDDHEVEWKQAVDKFWQIKRTIKP